MAPVPASSLAKLMLIGSGAESIPEGLEAQQFQRLNKQMPTYTLLQKVWNKAKPLQTVTGIQLTSHSGETTHAELAKIEQGPRWHPMGIKHLRHVFHNGTLLVTYSLNMHYHPTCCSITYN